MLLRIVLLVVVYCGCVCRAGRFAPSQLEFGKRSRSPHLTMEEQVKTGSVYYHENTCFEHTEVAIYNDNQPRPRRASDPQPIPGFTFWINEFFAPGHVFFILGTLKVIEDLSVDRIVFQRAPCVREDFCQGIGYYHSFFQGFFRTAMEAFGKNIPFYIRWNQNDPYQMLDLWDDTDRSAQGKFLDLSTSHNFTISPSAKLLPSIPMLPVTCFDRVLSRTPCDICNAEVLHPETIRKFKRAAYNLVNRQNTSAVPLQPRFHDSVISGHPIVILIAYRGGNAHRRIANVEEYLSTLRSQLSHLSEVLHLPIVIDTLDTSTNQLTFYDQIRAVGGAHVVISEHGAFQAHMLYMRRASLLVDLQANSRSPQFTDMFRLFGHMMEACEVYHAVVVAKKLTQHGQDSFRVDESEMRQIVDAVKDYLSEEAYKANAQSS